MLIYNLRKWTGTYKISQENTMTLRRKRVDSDSEFSSHFIKIVAYQRQTETKEQQLFRFLFDQCQIKSIM